MDICMVGIKANAFLSEYFAVEVQRAMLQRPLCWLQMGMLCLHSDSKANALRLYHL